MKRSSGSKKRSVEQVEALFEKVREMKRGGDLEGMLVEEIGKVKRLIYEEALEERGRLAASSEAVFAPRVCPHCGEGVMRPVGKRTRTIRTLGGETTYEREVYECRSCRRTQAPVDEEIGVGLGEKVTRGGGAEGGLRGGACLVYAGE